jgi:SAM-dependent methyltransferase
MSDLGVRRALRSISWGLEAASRAVLYLDIGTRSLESMQAATVDVWSDFNVDARAIDAGWMLWERHLVDRFVRAGDRVLLIGSGAGRDLIPFVAMGCDVTGVEPSPNAMAAARAALAARGLSATLIEGFVEHASLDGDFDVIWFSYCCYSYIFGSVRRGDLLRRLRHHLRAGGRIVLTCHGTSDGRRPESRLMSMARVANRWRSPGWQLEPGDVFERAHGKSSGFQYVHLFSAGEVEAEARAAGYAVEATDVPDTCVLRL